ncbi:sulfate adenylyltransferase subunit CysN [Mesorhizobium sp. M0208]|uniref:sulfate adenylyltransferase subunit CysN n=1 Tax=Mesorhizobium sp. M0208 TaxID=2956916 RepID=UPI0033373F2B
MNAIPIDPAAISQYLERHESKDLLRFLTCGSVDDGKSTLIGRLLYDAKLLFEDQLAGLRRDSRKHGTTGDDIDFALLVDGLEAEREQGITIDVAYRFFSTHRRKFIVADTPGHEQYTPNMATGASNAELAVILIDARKGVLKQTHRHTFIASLLGIKHLVAAINKIDLVDYSQKAFDRIGADYQTFAADLGFKTLLSIPMSARFGDNVAERSARLAWYEGPTLIEHLETVDVVRDETAGPFRLPVQWVNRPNLNFRGYSGTIARGVVNVGDPVVVAQSGCTSRVKSIITYDGQHEWAAAGEAITLVLEHEIDVSRGDIVCAAASRPEVSDQFSAHVIWMSDDELIPGRTYYLKIGSRTVGASVMEIKHKVDVNTFQKLAAKTLHLNEIGAVNLSTREPIAFEPYSSNRVMGGFIMIDRLSNQTVGAGMIVFALRRASNIHWQAVEINKSIRSRLKGQKPVILWFTGLSGAGKSTIANLVEKRLVSMGRHTYLLDGDNVRHDLNRDLGFTDADRVENLRRASEVGKLMVDAGLIVLASFISPFRAERKMARELFAAGEYVEIFVDTPLHVAEKRDPKGLYKRARLGRLKNFTGIDSPYEEPELPEIVLAAGVSASEELAEQVINYLAHHGYIDR